MISISKDLSRYRIADDLLGCLAKQLFYEATSTFFIYHASYFSSFPSRNRAESSVQENRWLEPSGGFVVSASTCAVID